MHTHTHIRMLAKSKNELAIINNPGQIDRFISMVITYISLTYTPLPHSHTHTSSSCFVIEVEMMNNRRRKLLRKQNEFNQKTIEQVHNPNESRLRPSIRVKVHDI